jgi:ubiquinone/menaquinone biosynthesis C-methylase UbiE
MTGPCRRAPGLCGRDGVDLEDSAPRGAMHADYRMVSVRATISCMGSVEEILQRMRRDWDERARANAMYFIDTANEAWSEQEFFRSGEAVISEQILTDMTNICQGEDPKQMKVLEIGCGAGRITRALASVFGEVHGVDVSGEMVSRARKALADRANVFLYQNNGMDLTVLGNLRFDFAFSFIVFQHIPSLAIIENYIREVYRLLRPGALFKFQVQGASCLDPKTADTWVGAAVSEEMAVEMAFRCGFEPRYRHGAEGQYFWLWYFKRDPAFIRYFETSSRHSKARRRAAMAAQVLGRYADSDWCSLEEALADESRAEEDLRAARQALLQFCAASRPREDPAAR